MVASGLAKSCKVDISTEYLTQYVRQELFLDVDLDVSFDDAGIMESNSLMRLEKLIKLGITRIFFSITSSF